MEKVLKAIETAAACKAVRDALAASLDCKAEAEAAHTASTAAPLPGGATALTPASRPMTDEEVDAAWDAHLRYLAHDE
jgi:hypothetical protein